MQRAGRAVYGTLRSLLYDGPLWGRVRRKVTIGGGMEEGQRSNPLCKVEVRKTPRLSHCTGTHFAPIVALVKFPDQFG